MWRILIYYQINIYINENYLNFSKQVVFSNQIYFVRIMLIVSPNTKDKRFLWNSKILIN